MTTPAIETAAHRACLEDVSNRLERAAFQLNSAVCTVEEEMFDDRKQLRYLKDACRAVAKSLVNASDGIVECLES